MSIKTLVVTIPGMIEDTDLMSLKAVSDVIYHEVASITQEELGDLCNGMDYLMLNYDVVKKVDDAFYSHPNVLKLKGISFDITGLDWANPHLAQKYNLLLMNTPRYSTGSVAESTLCEVLLHSRKVHAAYRDLIHGKEPEARKGINLQGRTAGVIGLGNIGNRVAELLHGMGMNVIAWNRSPKNIPHITSVSLEQLFKESDVICVCLKSVMDGPDSTVNFIGDKFLKESKPGLILVNLASKHLIDHKALYPYLVSGQIAGYSVTRNKETLAMEIAILDTVSMPPANAWFSDESLQLLKEIWVGNVVSAIQGEPANVFKD